MKSNIKEATILSGTLDKQGDIQPPVHHSPNRVGRTRSVVTASLAALMLSSLPSAAATLSEGRIEITSVDSGSTIIQLPRGVTIRESDTERKWYSGASSRFRGFRFRPLRDPKHPGWGAVETTPRQGLEHIPRLRKLLGKAALDSQNQIGTKENQNFTVPPGNYRLEVYGEGKFTMTILGSGLRGVQKLKTTKPVNFIHTYVGTSPQMSTGVAAAGVASYPFKAERANDYALMTVSITDTKQATDQRRSGMYSCFDQTIVPGCEQRFITSNDPYSHFNFSIAKNPTSNTATYTHYTGKFGNWQIPGDYNGEAVLAELASGNGTVMELIVIRDS